MKLQQIDHIALRCRAPQASKDWYVGVLGFEHIHPGLWGGVPIFLRLGSTYLALFPQEGDEGSQANTGIDHFALRAAKRSDFVEAREQLRALGIPFKFEDHQISHSLYLTDPDGHKVEITTYDL